ncbi:DinI-like family protein, partial [Vibrio parahaemolyticus]|nr:DinI-like family protein [Vibrio parahaemolyticus]
PDVRIRVRKGTNNNLELYSKDKDEKKAVQKLIEQAFNEADEWLLM